LEALDNPDKALLALDEALRRPEYDVSHFQPAGEYIEYTRACVYCFKARKDGPEETEILFGKAMECLKKAVEHDNSHVREAFAKERNQYFDALEKHPFFGPQFAGLMETA